MRESKKLRTVLSALALAAIGMSGAMSPGLDVVAHAQGRGAPTTSIEAPPSSDGVVNIQTASPEELERLPGIGPSKAAAIVAFRERSPFRRVEDIMRVRGIGRATFRRLRSYLTVAGPTTLAPSTRRARTSRAEDEASAEAP